MLLCYSSELFKTSSLQRGFHAIRLRKLNNSWLTNATDLHRRAKHEPWRGSVLCSLYKVSGVLQTFTVLFFCNSGRRMYEKKKKERKMYCTFWSFPSFAKTACSAQNIQNSTSLPFPFSWCSRIQSQNGPEEQARNRRRVEDRQKQRFVWGFNLIAYGRLCFSSLIRLVLPLQWFAAAGGNRTPLEHCFPTSVILEKKPKLSNTLG